MKEHLKAFVSIILIFVMTISGFSDPLAMLASAQAEDLNAAHAAIPVSEVKESGGWLYRVCADGNAQLLGYTDTAAQSLTLPKAVDGYWIVRLSENAFADNTGLERVTIPAQIGEIPDSAFSAQSNLTATGYNGSAAMKLADRRGFSWNSLSQYDFFEDVLDLSEIKSSQWSLNGTVLTLDAPYSLLLREGGKIYLPPKGDFKNGTALTVSSISFVGDSAAAKIEALNFMEAVRSYHAEDLQMMIDREHIQILNDGVSLDTSVSRGKLDATLGSPLTFNVKIPITTDVTVEGKLKFGTEITASVDYGFFTINRFEMTEKDTTGFEGEVVYKNKLLEHEETDSQGNKKIAGEITLAKAPLYSAGLLSIELEIKLSVDFSGKIKIKYETVTKTSIVFENGEVWHTKDTEKKELQSSAAFELSAKLDAELNVKLGFDGPFGLKATAKIAALSASAEIKGTAKTDYNVPGCVDLEINFIFKIKFSIGILKVDLGGSSEIADLVKKAQLNFSWDLFTITIPIWKKHWEATTSSFVDKCLQAHYVEAEFYYGVKNQKYSQTVVQGSKLESPPTVYNPGYFIDGWYQNEDFSGNAWSFASDTVQNDITLYAHWAEGNVSPGDSGNGWEDGETPASEFLYNDNGNSISILKYIGSRENIIIPKFIDNKLVTYIAAEAFKNCEGIVSVTIPDSVSRINSNTFLFCRSLKNITIPNSVSVIGYNAFRGCSSLESIVIPSSVTSIETGAFYNCGSLKSINIPDGVTEISDDTFYDCRSLISVTIPNGVTYIGRQAFWGCSSLTDITIPSSVSLIDISAFSGCRSLTDITIPYGVTIIRDNAFADCHSMVTVTIPDSVTSIGGGIFGSCDNLQSITLSNNITNIPDTAFNGCLSLASIVIPSGVTHIGYCAFQHCSNLSYISIPDSLTSIDAHAFFGCSNLSSIRIPNGIISLDTGIFGGCTRLIDVTIPESVTYIGTSLFWNCSSLQNITIPENVTTMEKFVFMGCSSLNSITIPDTVVNIDSGLFDNCSQPITAYVDSLQGTPATYLANNYSNVQLVVRPPQTAHIQFNPMGGRMTETNATVNIGSLPEKPADPTREGYCFTGWYTDSECQTPYAFNMPVTEDLFLFAGWTPIVGAFTYTVNNGQATITSYAGDDVFLVIPAAVNGIPVTALADGAIPSGVITLTLPASMTHIDPRAFRYASSLTNIYTANGSAVYSSQDGVLFRDNTLVCYPAMHGQTAYTVPAGTASLGDYAFCNVFSLQQLFIPSSVKTLGQYSVYDCKNLYQIAFDADAESIGGGTFLNCADNLNVTGPLAAQTLSAYAESSYINYNMFTVYYVQDGEIIGMAAAQAGGTVGLPVPEKLEEKAFLGWATDAAGSDYWNSGWQMPAEDLVLYAVYGYYFDYAIIQAYIDGPDVTDPYVESVRLYRYLGSDTLIRVPEMIDGRKVTGIHDSCFPDHSVTLIGNKGSVTQQYAQSQGITFTPLTYTLRFVTNGGTPAGNQTLCATDTVTLPQTIRTGYRLTGWYTDAALMSPWSDTAMPASDLTLYAGWAQEDDNAPVVPFTFESIAGGLKITGYTGNEMTAEIPSTINGQTVVEIGEKAFANTSILRTLTIPASVKRIGKSAFADTLLTSVTMAGVTEIGDHAFADCTALNQISLSGSLTQIGAFAFQNCGALKTISISDQVNALPEGLFAGCAWLKSVTLPTSLETVASGAFRDCGRLTAIQMGASVSEIAQGAFDGCSALATVAVASGNMYYKTQDGVLFNKAGTQLLLYPQGKTNETYTIPESVSSVGEYAAAGSKIKYLVLGSGVRTIGQNAFRNAISLSQITFNSVLNNIEANAFEGCQLLKTAVLPESVTRVGVEAFDMAGLTSITIPASTELSKDAIPENDGLIIYGKRGSDAELYAQVHGIRFIDLSADIPVTGISIPNSLSIPAGKSQQITAVLTPDNTTETAVVWASSDERIAVVDENGIVEGHAVGTATVTAKAANGTAAECAIEVMGNTQEFAAQGTCGDNLNWTLDANGLLTISGTGPMGNYDLPDPSHPFYAIRNDIRSVVIENGITWIGEGAFARLDNLISVIIPDSVTGIGDLGFCECRQLSDIVLPDTVTLIGASSFESCEALTSINIPANISSICWGAFIGCYNLKHLTLPENTPTKDFIRCYEGDVCDVYLFELPASLQWLDDCAFAQTDAGELLMHISPDFVLPQYLKTVEAEAFAGINATCIHINSQMTIESKAFANCKQLRYVLFTENGGYGYQLNLADDAFEGCENLIIFATPGYSNSAIEQFAIEHGYQYFEIEGLYGNG